MVKKLICVLISTLFIITIFPIAGIGGEDSNKINENILSINQPFYTYERPYNPDYESNFAIFYPENVGDIPTSFDLRNVEGKNYVTSIKLQSGGTCWAHAVIACMESNLLINEKWEDDGEPNLAEYHLDWWDGFNTFFNEDNPESDGLTPHNGAHCRIAAAYLARGEGAVFSDAANDETELDDNWFFSAPDRFDEDYHIYYPRNIEIYDIKSDLSNIDLIKSKIMSDGPIDICFRIDGDFMNNNFVHYQPKTSSLQPNHNVAIMGWDDNKASAALQDGAWLVKNSWSSAWGLDGYFWISYYDKYCCHPYDGDEWTASFQDVELMNYKRIYYHDYHGWQGNYRATDGVFNVFTAVDNEIMTDVSFFTCNDNVDYTIKVYDDFENNQLINELSSISGTIDHTGFHTVKLIEPVSLKKDDQFYLYLDLSDGWIPYDKTNNVWGYTVDSISNPGESYYYQDGSWHDLYEKDNTGNFCIKGLVSKASNLECDDQISWNNVKMGSSVTYDISISNIGDPQSKLNWEITSYPDWGTWEFSPEEGVDLTPEDGIETVQLTVIAPQIKNREFKGEIIITNKDYSCDYEIIQITLSTPKNKAISTFLQGYLENHPNLFAILRQLLENK